MAYCSQVPIPVEVAAFTGEMEIRKIFLVTDA